MLDVHAEQTLPLRRIGRRGENSDAPTTEQTQRLSPQLGAGACRGEERQDRPLLFGCAVIQRPGCGGTLSGRVRLPQRAEPTMLEVSGAVFPRRRTGSGRWLCSLTVKIGSAQTGRWTTSACRVEGPCRRPECLGVRAGPDDSRLDHVESSAPKPVEGGRFGHNTVDPLGKEIVPAVAERRECKSGSHGLPVSGYSCRGRLLWLVRGSPPDRSRWS